MNTKLLKLAGKSFGRWLVVELSAIKPFKSPQSFWVCKCKCGTVKIIASQALRSGTSRSCGCYKQDLHDLLRVPEYVKKESRAKKAAIKDKTPRRREQKRMTQMRYVTSEKAIIAHLRRWLKRRKNTINLSDSEYLEFRKLPCSGCGKTIEGLALGFSLIKPRKPIEISNMVSMCGVCKMIVPKASFSAVEFSKKILRRFWKRTPMVATAMQKAKCGRGKYQCAHCKNIFGPKEIQIDHRSPVVDPLIGYVDLDTFATRLFCDDSNLDILCKPCHAVKTSSENSTRFEIKALKKGPKDVKPKRTKKKSQKRSTGDVPRNSNKRVRERTIQDFRGKNKGTRRAR